MGTAAPHDRDLSHDYSYSKAWDVSIKVVTTNGACPAGHKVGDKWDITFRETPEGMCTNAFMAALPFARVLMYGGSFDWRADPDSVQVNCPEAKAQVVLELRREAVSNEFEGRQEGSAK